MVVDQGLSYATIANRYNVNYDSVFQSLKLGALRAGDTWPIERDLRRAVRRGVEEATIDAVWVRSALNEAFEEAQEDFLPETVYVNRRQALLAEHEKGRRPKYHRPGCAYNKPTDVPVPMAKIRNGNSRYLPCGTCCRQLSLREWSKQIGIEQSHLSMVMQKKVTRIKKSTAIRMMRAIGEEPHPTLANWQPNWQARKWQRTKVAS